MVGRWCWLISVPGRLTYLDSSLAKAFCACRGGRVVRWYWVNFQFQGVLLIWIRVGQGTSALAVGAGGGCLDVFLSSINFLFPLSGRRPDIDLNTVSKGR